jgi:trimethylamine--corrinoid protein Co-methyltransferase
MGTGGITDSKILDQQAAIESTFTLLAMALSGNSLIHDVGFIESGLTSSRESIVMGDDIISLVKAFLEGVDINPDTLALDLIDKVGPGGHFLTEDHTLKYFKTEAWYPEYMDRRNYAAWVERGGKSMGEILNEKVRWILENHEPEPLAAPAREAMSEIITKREKELS